MRVGSLFTGIGGFDCGFEIAGCDLAWQSEIEPYCLKVLAARFPGVPNIGDVTHAQPAPVDVMVGGFPCQDLSVAGQRKGLDGERSGLFFAFMYQVAVLQPQWVVIENVPGLISSKKGDDFGIVLSTLETLGYGWAYRVVDSQYFGVPQRRRRVFIVGCLGGQWQRAAEVLFEPASGGRDFAARGKKRQDIAVTLRGRSKKPGVNIPGRGGEDDFNIVVAATLRASDGHHGHSSPRGDGQDNLVVGTLTAKAEGGWRIGADEAAAGHIVAVNGRATATMHKRHDEDTDTLIPFDTTQITSPQNRSRPQSGDPCHPLAAGAHPPAIAYNWQTGQGQFQPSDTVTPTLGVGQTPAVGVRRLTPLECERLQGFPDGWTCLCAAKGVTALCKCPDSLRYRALGNAVTVNVIVWIARRLVAVNEGMHRAAA